LWKAGINLTSRSGNTYTPVKYTAAYREVNSKRFKNHHRLDVSVSRITNFWGLEGLIKFVLINAFASEHFVDEELAYDFIVDHGDDDIEWAVDNIDGDDSDIIPSIGFSVIF